MSVPTSIKIGEDTKDRLEQLQAELKLETGRKVTQQELLDRIVEREFAAKDALIDSFRDEWEGLSEAEIDEWLSGTVESGIEGDVEPDVTLYGDEYLRKKLGIDEDTA